MSVPVSKSVSKSVSVSVSMSVSASVSVLTVWKRDRSVNHGRASARRTHITLQAARSTVRNGQNTVFMIELRLQRMGELRICTSARKILTLRLHAGVFLGALPVQS